MSRIFMTGFEAGYEYGTFNGAGSDVSLDTTHQRSGDYSARLSVYPGTGDYGYLSQFFDGYGGVVVGDAPDEIYIRLYMRIDTNVDMTTEEFPILTLSGNASGATPILYIDSVGEVYSYYSSAWHDLGGMASPFDHDDSYYLWEFYIRLSTNDLYPDGQVIIKREDVEVYNQDNIQTHEAAAVTQIGRVEFGPGAAGAPSFGSGLTNGYMYLDDIAINDTVGSRNISWVGAGSIIGIQVTGEGTYSEFTPTPGSGEDNWEDVDDVPANDATYVSSTSLGDKDTYLVEDPATKGIGSESIISAVQYLIRGKLPSAGSSTIYPYYIFRGTGETQLAAEEITNITFDYIPAIFDEDPVTSQLWLASSIRDSEFGIEQG